MKNKIAELMQPHIDILEDEISLLVAKGEACGVYCGVMLPNGRVVPIGEEFKTRLVIATSYHDDGTKDVQDFIEGSLVFIDRVMKVDDRPAATEDVAKPRRAKRAEKRQRTRSGHPKDRRDEWIMHFIDRRDADFTRRQIVADVTAAVADGSCPYPGAVSEGALSFAFKQLIEVGLIKEISGDKPRRMRVTPKWLHEKETHPGLAAFDVAAIALGHPQRLSDFVAETSDEDESRHAVVGQW